MPNVLPPPRALAWLVGAALLGGCSSNKASCLPTGECVPTVEGVAAVGYPDAPAAVQAFSRSSKDGAFLAVLEDVAWLRFEGEEETVIKKHRAYFDQGYTTFSVTLMTKEFTQPTAEVFLLTDSLGANLTGKPITYAGTMGQENERFAARFQVSFRHAITRQVDWIRLKRLADGAELEWVFPWAPKAPAAGAATSASAPLTRPENLWQPRNAAPEPAVGATGRPSNILTAQPAASAPTGFPAPAPAPAADPLPPSASVGEPTWSTPPPPSAMPPAPPAALPPAGPATPPAGSLPPPAVRRR